MKDKLIGLLGIAGIYLYYFFNLLLALMPILMLGVPWWGVLLLCLAQLVLPFPTIQQGILYALSFSNVLERSVDFFTILYFISFAIFAFCILITILRFILSLR